MKRRLVGLTLALVVVLVISAVIWSAPDPVTVYGVAKGFGGDVKVAVTLEGDKIVKVEVDAPYETRAVAGAAIERIPQAIVAANSPDVDVVSGATITSRAIINAVRNALNPEAAQEQTAAQAKAPKAPEAVKAAKVYQGFGLHNSFRVGPGVDDTGTQVYSINQVFAHALFDEDGRILALHVDQLEIATPNYDGASMPHFSGFPGQGGYNWDKDHDGKVDGKTPDTEEFFLAEVASWQTKRERGDSYVMGTGTWRDQMDAYQELFIGMTVDEVEQWFAKYTSDRNGRPLNPNTTNAQDKAKFDALTPEEQKMLADVVTRATMSLNDSHGNIIGAIRAAYENRVPIDIEKAAALGTAVVSTPRVGPGTDDTGTQVYSINQVFANAVYDEEGRILALYIDQLEVATPNYDGAGMPHFSGFPGQGGYNWDKDHDGKVDGKTPDTVEQATAEVAGWVTKRQRGDTYVMGTGTWYQQMDAYQEIFKGMTVDEVEQWVAKYTSDRNRRPLNPNTTNAQDKAKFDALSPAEKQMLADVVTRATMSLNDSHGDIVGAIKKSYAYRVPIDITVE